MNIRTSLCANLSNVRSTFLISLPFFQRSLWFESYMFLKRGILISVVELLSEQARLSRAVLLLSRPSL